MYSNRGVKIRRGGGDEQSLYVNPLSLGRQSRGPDGRTSGRLICSQLDGKTLDAEVVGELADDHQAGPGADVSIDPDKAFIVGRLPGHWLAAKTRRPAAG